MCLKSLVKKLYRETVFPILAWTASHSLVTLSTGLYISTDKQLYIAVAFMRSNNFFSSP